MFHLTLPRLSVTVLQRVPIVCHASFGDLLEPSVVAILWTVGALYLLRPPTNRPALGA